MVIFATATVLASVLLRDSRFNFHCYTQREATPTQKSARKCAATSRDFLRERLQSAFTRANQLRWIAQYIHTHACAHVYIHTCTAVIDHFSDWPHAHTHTTATQAHGHTGTYTVWHSMKDLRHAVDPGQNTDSTGVGLILWLEVEWKSTCSVIEFALWDSVTVNRGKQLIFWMKDVCSIRHSKLLKIRPISNCHRTCLSWWGSWYCTHTPMSVGISHRWCNLAEVVCETFASLTQSVCCWQSRELPHMCRSTILSWSRQ